MGKIHLVSTNKRSRLHLGKSGLVLCDLNFGKNTINGQNIFISSDEDVKEGDWYYYKDKENYEHIFKWSSGFVDNTAKYGKKIILTTDGDLITDGIQAIDNEFLEWFVKNPTREFVMTLPDVRGLRDIFQPTEKDLYKIIIPQEEPKQETLEEVECNNCGYLMSLTEDESVYACYNSECTSCYEEYEEEPKQETLEEAAEKYSNNFVEDESKFDIEDFIKGAKWQSERMYSEEEVLLNRPGPYLSDEEIKEWFQQHKK